MNNLIQEIPIFDGHNDSFKKSFLNKQDFFSFNEAVHLDLPKLLSSIMKGGFFSIMIPPEDMKEREFGYGLSVTTKGWEVRYPRPLKFEYAVSFTDKMINYIVQLTQNSNQLEIVKSFSDLKRCFEKKVIAVLVHLEGAEAISPDFSNLDKYYEQGVRSLGIVWSRENAFGYGAPFKFPFRSSGSDLGLTKAGKELVKHCNERGIILDLSHLNQPGFFDVAELSSFPLVVSHANVHQICQSSSNLTDDQIDLVAQSRGVIGINFDVLNSRPDGKFIKETPLSVITDHIQYIADRVGIDHVAFGSDFDGAQIPTKLGDVTGFAKIINLLRELGFSDEHLRKISYQNWFRVIRETWQSF